MSAEEVLCDLVPEEVWYKRQNVVLDPQLDSRPGRGLDLVHGLRALHQSLLAGRSLQGKRSADKGPEVAQRAGGRGEVL